MSRAESTIAKTFAVALAAFAVAAPTASGGQDLRSPDRQQPAADAGQDLRSPDTRDVASVPPSPETRTFRDLVSPDARDSARDIVRVPVPAPVAASTGGRGFEWDDAVVGGGAVAGLLAVGLAGLTLRRRHHGPGKPAVI